MNFPEGKSETKALRGLLAALCFLFLFFAPCMKLSARAETWPYPGGTINAGAAVVIDADTATVLWGKNADSAYYPASITKLMTALLVLENCSLDEKVEITPEAVNDLERGATTASLSAGDVLTAEDLMYALLLRSANDAANALAIHISGSIQDFALLMTERAAELGCKHTVFKNPSGLTNSEHVTTAYDMALIMRELLHYQQFLEIESADSYKLAPTAEYPGGLTVTMGHRMLRGSTAYSDDRVIAGKTGFITASGNTLVTAATEGMRTVIVTVLKDTSPAHYEDTLRLMNFGLSSFDNVGFTDILEKFSVEDRLLADTIISGTNDHVYADDTLLATLPIGYDESLITPKYEYNLSKEAPDTAVAVLKLQYEGRTVGEAYIYDEPESNVGIDNVERIPSAARKAIGIGIIIVIIIAMFVFFGGGIRYRAAEEEAERRRRFNARKKRRLREMGISEEEFERYMAASNKARKRKAKCRR